VSNFSAYSRAQQGFSVSLTYPPANIISSLATERSPHGPGNDPSWIDGSFSNHGFILYLYRSRSFSLTRIRSLIFRQISSHLLARGAFHWPAQRSLLNRRFIFQSWIYFIFVSQSGIQPDPLTSPSVAWSQRGVPHRVPLQSA